MTEVVEQVARALCKENCLANGQNDSSDRETQIGFDLHGSPVKGPMWRTYERYAAAVMAAMRESGALK